MVKISVFSVILFTLSVIIVVTVVILATYLKRHKDNYTETRKIPHVKNPESNYWFWRQDNNAIIEMNPAPGIYLRQIINPPTPMGTCDQLTPCALWKTATSCIEGECIPHVNAEVYNNPCCKSQVSQLCGEIAAQIPSPNNYGVYVKKNLCDLFTAVCNSGTIGTEMGEVPSSWSDGKTCNISLNKTIVDEPTELTSIVRDTFMNNPYLYCTLKVCVKCTNVENGSQGWGFWNTTEDFSKMSYAWFMNTVGPSPLPQLEGFRIWIIHPGLPPEQSVLYKLPDLDEKWHDYEIRWFPTYIDFYIDGTKVFSGRGEQVPSTYMAFHGWVDNLNYEVKTVGEKIIPINAPQKFSKPRIQEFANFFISKNGS